MFVENGIESRRMVFDLCQSRPRDILTYTAFALGTAQSHKHEQIQIEDLQDARRRFSDSRLKDLGDEYQENYPQLSLVLSRFYALGQRWTLTGIEALLKRLFDDQQVISACKSWIYGYSLPEQFARLLYEIGFFGFVQPRRDGTKKIIYRSLGPRSTTPPAVNRSVDISVHPSYWDALELQDLLVTEFRETEKFRSIGLVTDLPGALDYEDYRQQLTEVSARIRYLPTGQEHAAEFEETVGIVLRLCFFRVLANIDDQVRDIDGTIRRDWVAGNRGETGFWEMVRHRYGATQVIFECKNYDELKSGDFQQASYYMSEQGGKLVIIVFRGEMKTHYYQHIQRVCQKGGLILILNDKDLLVFIRQSINGKSKRCTPAG